MAAPGDRQWFGRRENPFIKPTTLPYFRDIHDYTVQIIEMIESTRDILSGLLDIYLSSQNNRMNEVMKVTNNNFDYLSTPYAFGEHLRHEFPIARIWICGGLSRRLSRPDHSYGGHSRCDALDFQAKGLAIKSLHDRSEKK